MTTNHHPGAHRPPEPLCLRLLREEHQALADVLRTVLALLGESRQQGTPPEWAVLRQCLAYIRAFPDRWHHAKEERLLFPLLRERTPVMTPLLDRLEREHAQGPTALDQLDQALQASVDAPRDALRRERFDNLAARYVEFYLAHIGVEEQTLLPAALHHLGPQDWVTLDAAFAEHREPLHAALPAPEWAALQVRLLSRQAHRPGAGERGMGPASLRRSAA